MRNTIEFSLSVREALDLLNSIADKSFQTLFVLKDQKVIGTLTDGDIRRGLIKGLSIENEIMSFANTSFLFLRVGERYQDRLAGFNKNNVSLLPVIDKNGLLTEIIDITTYTEQLPVTAVIMAGGKGKRLRPLTSKKPKPLLEVGGIPILERNLNLLAKNGISKIAISVNYLGEQIKEYIGNGDRHNLEITYQDEKQFYGTAGALSEIEDYSENNVLVMNSDLLTNIDFNDFFQFYKSSNADILIATIPYQVNIPYAVLENDASGRVLSLKEKPVYTYYSNAGIYLMNKDVIKMVPKTKRYDATDLIEDCLKMNKKIVSYPIRGYWLDIGKMEDYDKAQEDVKHIKF